LATHAAFYGMLDVAIMNNLSCKEVGRTIVMVHLFVLFFSDVYCFFYPLLHFIAVCQSPCHNPNIFFVLLRLIDDAAWHTEHLLIYWLTVRLSLRYSLFIISL